VRRAARRASGISQDVAFVREVSQSRFLTSRVLGRGPHLPIVLETLPLRSSHARGIHFALRESLVVPGVGVHLRVHQLLLPDVVYC
jgi:hypothetical protein